MKPRLQITRRTRDLGGGLSVRRAPPSAERVLCGVDPGFTLDGESLPAQTVAVMAPCEEPLVAGETDFIPLPAR